MLFLAIRPASKNAKQSRYSPKALVIVPCKGIDLTLKENLKSIKSQKYKNFDIVCVVDDKNDKALPTIKKLNIDFIFSKASKAKGSGKVQAVATALKKFPKYEAYAIADSDVIFSQGWLSSLLGALGDKNIGISTAYPFFDPLSGFWSRVKSVWGLVGEGMMESEITRFGWGGSLAFKNDLLGPQELRFFTDSISDDIALTKISRQKGKKIAYIGSDKLTVYARENALTFFEWSNRQTALSIFGNDRIFYFGFIIYFAQLVLIISGIILAYFNLLYLFLLLPFAISTFKSYKRSRKKDLIFFWISLMLPAIYLSNVIAGRFTRWINWRGKRYFLR